MSVRQSICVEEKKNKIFDQFLYSNDFTLQIFLSSESLSKYLIESEKQFIVTSPFVERSLQTPADEISIGNRWFFHCRYRYCPIPMRYRYQTLEEIQLSPGTRHFYGTPLLKLRNQWKAIRSENIQRKNFCDTIEKTLCNYPVTEDYF